MALTRLELRKTIDEKKSMIVEMEKRSADFEKREAQLADQIEKAETDEQKAEVEQSIEALNAEKEETAAEMQGLQEEIDKMEDELAQLEADQPSSDAEEKKERMDGKMKNVEIRASREYNEAFIRGMKEGKYDEARALLTEGVDSGVVPVPEMLEAEIKTAWEQSGVMALVKKSQYKGNVRIGFEVSATGATVHVEGTDAPDEEEIVIGSVELKAQNIKKWITVSDEAIEGTTVDTIGYLYKEIAQKIVEAAEAVAVGKIIAQPTTANSTHPGVPVCAMNPAAETVVTAISMLSGSAKDLYMLMNRQTYPAFVKIALEAGYAIDVFDGLKDKIVFTDALKSFSAATAGNTGANGTYAIIGDFGSGFQANMPNGNDITMIIDRYSLAEKDLVKVVGRQYVGMDVVAPKHFVKLCKVTTA